MKKYLIALLFFFYALASQGQAPCPPRLVSEDSLSLVTGGPSVTKNVSIIKGSDYKLILLEVPSGHEGYDVIISFKPKVTVDPTPVYLDNLANLTVNSQLVNTYTTAAQWIAGTPAGHYGNTVQFSSATNSTLVTKFTGTQIQWIHEQDKHLGIAAISIDNGPETLVDVYNTTNLKQQSKYTSPVLTRGLHTIKLRVTGTKNPAATGVYVVHDAWKVTP